MSEIEQLREELATTRAELEAYRERYQRALERARILELGILTGRKSERLRGDDEAQMSMQLLALLKEAKEDGASVVAVEDEPSDADDDETGDDDDGVVEGGRARGRGRARRALPEALPRVEIEVTPPEVQVEGLAAFRRIGEEVSEVVERRPASLVVVRIVRPKYARKDAGPATIAEQLAEETPAAPAVVIAAPPERPIERGLAGPGLLAQTLTMRWQDHLPLHRQEAIFARDGLPLARQTICDWHLQLADLCAPLVDAMMVDAFTAPYVCVDATGVLVQAEEQCKRAHFWVLVAPGRHVLYRYSERHDSRAVDRLLAGYKGYLVADAAAVYNHLYESGEVIEVGCWAHCRRYFFRALESEPELAKQALGMIGKLFKIEAKLAEVTRAKRESVRRKESAPVVEAFFKWCEVQAETALDGSPIAAALTYATNQQDGLQRFLKDGRLPLDNNISERALRREAVGRKNWIFVGSDDGARANTIFVSLLASCQMHGVEPQGYLRDLLCLLPSWPRSRVLELAPASWQKTLEQQETQQRLAANVFRAVALGEHPRAV